MISELHLKCKNSILGLSSRAGNAFSDKEASWPGARRQSSGRALSASVDSRCWSWSQPPPYMRRCYPAETQGHRGPAEASVRPCGMETAPNSGFAGLLAALPLVSTSVSILSAFPSTSRFIFPLETFLPSFSFPSIKISFLSFSHLHILPTLFFSIMEYITWFMYKLIYNLV